MQAGKTRVPRLAYEAHVQAPRSEWGTDTNTCTGDHDDRRSSLEVSDRESLEADNHSAVMTERSTVSVGGESLDTQDSFGWRRPQWGHALATHSGPHRYWQYCRQTNAHESCLLRCVF